MVLCIVISFLAFVSTRVHAEELCGGKGTPLPSNSSSQTHMTCIGGTDCPSGHYCWSGDDDKYCCPIVANIEPPPVGCIWGLEPLKDAGGNVVTCQPGQKECPGGATCYYDSIENVHKCCGKGPGEGCPRGNKPSRDATGNMIRCLPGSSSQPCPSGSACQWSYLIDRYQCCQYSDGCPENMSVLKDQSGNPTPCTSGSTSSCASNYQCSFNFWTVSYQCCGPTSGSTNTCPAGMVPYITPQGSEMTCYSFQTQVCPAGYQCAAGIGTTQSVCCGIVGSCPFGYSAVLNDNQQVTPCYPGSVTSCTAPAQCLAATGGAANQNLCCTRGTSATTPTCSGVNRIPENSPGTNSPRLCSAVGSQTGCSFSYLCEQSGNQPSVYLCCPTGSSQSQILCPSGVQPAYRGQTPVYCINEADLSCQSGYSCQRALGYSNVYACCPSTTTPTSSAQCPTGYTPNFVGSYPQTCQPSNPNTCLSPFQCTQAINRPGHYICCSYGGGTSTSTQGICPSNGNALTIAGTISYCTGPFATCSTPSYTCQLSPRLQTYVCCGFQSQTGVQYQCASGKPVWAPNNAPYYCTVGMNQCPGSYNCELSTDRTKYVCCQSSSTTTSTAVCASGQSTYMYCTQQHPSCPAGYSCELSTTAGQYVCCYVGSTNFRCPVGFDEYRIGVDAQTCTANRGICPFSYSCMESTQTGTFVCCKSSAGLTPGSAQCSNGGQVVYSTNAQPQTCTPSYWYNSCNSNNYACVRDNQVTSRYICCTKTSQAQADNDKGCPSNSRPEYSSTGIVKKCRYNAECSYEYSCVSSITSIDRICCYGSDLSDSVLSAVQCLNGRDTLTVNGAAVSCRLPDTCQAGYECTTSTTTGVYACCRRNSVTTAVCPADCSRFGYACPDGYVCKTRLDDDSRYVCCKAKATCQRGWLPYIAPGTSTPLQCREGANDCNPPGHPYVCQMSSERGVHICCMQSLLQWEPERNETTSAENNSTDDRWNLLEDVSEFLQDLKEVEQKDENE